jgi:hypothetical protein
MAVYLLASFYGRIIAQVRAGQQGGAVIGFGERIEERGY